MIFLGIGSNLPSSFGDRFKNIELSILYLKEHNIRILKKSSFYETFSYPDRTQPKFINVVISIESNKSPFDLMSSLIFIEQKLERKRAKKNDPRTCDIDIIDFNGKVINLDFKNFMINLPHKKMSERNFVLHPLREICPEWIHPKTKKNIDLLIKNLGTNNEITKLNQNDIINSYVK